MGALGALAWVPSVLFLVAGPPLPMSPPLLSTGSPDMIVGVMVWLRVDEDDTGAEDDTVLSLSCHVPGGLSISLLSSWTTVELWASEGSWTRVVRYSLVAPPVLSARCCKPAWADSEIDGVLAKTCLLASRTVTDNEWTVRWSWESCVNTPVSTALSN